MLTRSDIWYDLPRGLIAQHPLPERSGSRLMVADRRTGSLTHAVFRDLPSFLSAGDLMVFNDTRVIRARLRGTRSGTGGTVEVLLLERLAPDTWKVVLKPGKQCRQGIRLDLSGRQQRTLVIQDLIADRIRRRKIVELHPIQIVTAL